jgi:hypothetical protein
MRVVRLEIHGLLIEIRKVDVRRAHLNMRLQTKGYARVPVHWKVTYRGEVLNSYASLKAARLGARRGAAHIFFFLTTPGLLFLQKRGEYLLDGGTERIGQLIAEARASRVKKAVDRAYGPEFFDIARVLQVPHYLPGG